MKEENKVEEKKQEEVVASSAAPEETKAASSSEKKGYLKVSVKTAIVVAVLIVVIALGYYYRSFFVAATVNGTPISRFDVMREAEKQTGKTILDNIILKKVIKDEAMKRKIVVTKAEVAAEITKLEEQLKSQNMTLDQALAQQGMTRSTLEEQISLQKLVEKMVPKATPVTDEEVTEAMNANGEVTIPKEQEDAYRAQVKAKLEKDKFSQAAQKMVDELKNNATIHYLVNY
jgi:foldase protein PrsA